MSSRLKLILALCGACFAGLTIGFLWGPREGVVVLIAALSGVVLGRISSRNDESAASAPVRPLNRIAGPNALAPSDEPASASALLEATMNGMREGVLVVDQTMSIVASNNAARAIFSSNGTPLERTRLSELTRNPAINSAFRTALEQNERTEVKIELLGNERRVFDLRVVPLRLGGDTNPRGVLGVFFDITQLERLERVRQEFLSNVSHELRTPLTSIIAFVETLEDGALNDPENGRHFLSIIRKNATRMHNLIDDILELSAIEAGNVTVEPVDVRLYAVVTDVMTSLAARADVRGIKICNEVPNEAIVFADARRLEQMLTNLIDNAIKFNREGGTVTIKYEKGARDRISVIDTGDGIPAEHIERIFERFYRVDRARSRALGGTGLGLAIVKHLARAHGGEVMVQSQIGEGSTFIIDLPPKPNALKNR